MSNFSHTEYNTEVNEEIADDDHILLHLDIDYFFAQVEIQKQPELKGKPVIVGHERARQTKRGVVLTCNYPAREFGVHSGQPMKTALEKCPNAIIVKSSYSEYRKYSDMIMGVLKDLGTPMRKAGIDEAYVDITPLVSNYIEAEELGKKIKQQIYHKTNLTVSIGIGPTLKIAKVGSDFNKPDGISVFPPNKLHILFQGLPLIDIPGIGKKTASKMKSLGYTTCDQLRKLNKAEMVDQFGSHGLYYYNILQGCSSNTIKSRGPRKSVSHSRTFVGKPGEIEKSLEMMDKLFDRSFSTLIEENFETRTVGVTVRFNGFDTITRSKTFPYHSQKRDLLYKATKKLIEPHLRDERGIRLLGVGFHNLRKISEDQTTLNEFFDFNMDPEEGVDPLEVLSNSSGIKVSKTHKKEKEKNHDLSEFFS